MTWSDRLPLHAIRIAVPNAITGSAILAGYISIIETYRHDYLAAAGFILIACVLDMLDGWMARIMRATTDFGVQFDSLADMVNYGVAPSLLFYFLYLEHLGLVGTILSFLPVFCAGIRLARFNVAADPDIPTKYYIGLPTTIAAMVLAGFVILTDFLGTVDASRQAALLIIITALLMVSSVQYEKSNILSLRYILKTRRILTGLTIIITMVFLPQIGFFAWGLLYILYGLTRSAVRTFLHRDDTGSEAEIGDEW